MSPEGKPRRHHHLNRESIARAALDLVDREGIEALSIRRLAAALDVGANNLYTYFPDRDAIVLAVLALLLAEIELPQEPDLSWEECAQAIGASLRAMALRHPRAFSLVALAADDDWPIAEHGRRVFRVMEEHGLPGPLVLQLSTLLDAFACGFLLLETRAMTRAPRQSWNPFPALDEPAVISGPGGSDADGAFEEGHQAVIIGFKFLHGLA